jgi:hypothetical protein
LVLTFSEALDRAGAENAANYHLVAAGRDGRFGTRDDRMIPIKSAVCDPGRHAITLTTAQRLSWTEPYEIWVNGSSPTGVTDLAGNLLDGNSDGKPGGDYVAVFLGGGLFTSPSPSGFGAGRDAFVTTLYTEDLGRSPEPSGLQFWSGRLAARVKPKTVALAIWRFPEHRALVKQHLAPPISFRRSFADAIHAAHQATLRPRSHPAGLSIFAVRVHRKR